MKVNIRRMIKELESKESELDEQESGVEGGGVSDGTSDCWWYRC